MFLKDDKVYSLIHGEGIVSEISLVGIPVKVSFDTEWFDTFTQEGYKSSEGITQMLYHGKPEIIAPPEPQRFPDLSMDQHILVRDTDNQKWKPRHFRTWSKETGRIVCWDNGKTSWTTNDFSAFSSHWNQWTLDFTERDEC